MALTRAIISAGLYWSDLIKAHSWARFARGRGVILTFHHVRPAPASGFSPNRLLEVTPEYLQTCLDVLDALDFEIVSLESVPERLTGPEPERPFAVLTFDDGYRDNRDVAAPILARRGAPWTLFVTPDFALGHGRFWWRELEEAVRRSQRVRVGDLDLPAATDAEKQRAFSTLYWRLREGPEDALRDATRRLAADAGFDAAAYARDVCLDFEELTALATDPNVTLGAHTLTHPMLAKWDAATARAEMTESRAEIEARTGARVRHLAYPVGDSCSAGPREFALAREAGFETAVTTRPGHVFADHRAHLHALPRVSINGLHQSAGALRALLSGLPLLAWNRGRRVNAG